MEYDDAVPAGLQITHHIDMAMTEIAITISVKLMITLHNQRCIHIKQSKTITQ